MADENDINDAIEDGIRTVNEAINRIMDDIARGLGPAASDLRVLANVSKNSSGAIKAAADQALKLAEAKEKEKAASEAYAAALRQSLSKLQVSLTSTVSSMGRGSAGFNDVMAVIDSAAQATGDALTKLGAVGKVAGASIKGLSKVATEAMKITSDAFAGFQDLSKVGATGYDSMLLLAEGITDTTMPLKDYTKFITQNSQALAALSGSTLNSADTFGEAMRMMREGGDAFSAGTDQQLRKLGYSTEEIGETMIFYADMQRKLGTLQELDSTKLAAATLDYGKELDELTKITGMSRQQQMDEMDKANRNSRFMATIQEMQARGQTEQAAELYKLNNILAAASPEMQAAFQDSISGVTSSTAAQKGFVTSQGALMRSIEDIKSRGVSAVEGFVTIQEGVKGNLQTMASVQKFIGDEGPYQRFYNSANLASFAMADAAAAAERNAEQQKKQTQGEDPRIENLVNAQKAIAAASVNLQAIATDMEIIGSAVKSASQFAQATTEAIGELGRSDLPIVGQLTRAPTTGGAGGTAEAEVQVTSPVFDEIKELDVKRNSLLEEIKTHPALGETATDEEQQAYLELQQELSDVEDQLKILNTKLPTADQITATQKANTTALSNILVEQLQREKGVIGTADYTAMIAGTSMMSGDLRVNPAKEAQIKSFIAESGGLIGPDGEYNKQLINAIKGIARREDVPMQVPVQEYARGGIATGPKSGYQATLHGTEAIVPLDANRAIPVEITDSRDMKPQLDVMEKQILKLDEITGILKEHISVSEQILRHSRN